MLSLGTLIAQHKWKHVLSGQKTAYGLVKQPVFSRQDKNEAVAWLMFFALESEILELAEVVDERSFRRFESELVEELAYLGRGYIDHLITFYNDVQKGPHKGERRYRFIAASLRTVLQSPPPYSMPRGLPGCDLEAPDPELDELELTIIKSTCVARFFGRMLSFDGSEWVPRNTLLTSCQPANRCDSVGALAIAGEEFDFRRVVMDRHYEIVDAPRPERVVGISVGNDEWLLRPARGFGKANITRSPPKSEIVVVPHDPALRTAFNASLQLARSGNRRASMYFNALERNNFSLLVGEDPLPNTDKALDDRTFQRNWDRILNCIEPGDMLFSRDTRDRLSSIIARADSGSWSHCVSYIGDGLVHEVELTGQNMMPLEVYAKCPYRLGLFRNLARSEVSAVRRQAFKRWHLKHARHSIGLPYDYFGALRAGLNSMLRASPKRWFTPNALIRSGLFIPVVLS